MNPVLWRQTQLNAASGLFKVMDKVYQIRGFDLANMTIIKGDSGLIIIDPLTSIEVSKAGLELYYENRSFKPASYVIYTHSHMDHFGGAGGIVSQEDIADGKVQVLAPHGFTKEAVSENILAGTAMLRRTIFYSGIMSPKGPEGSMDAGLGPGGYRTASYP